MKYCNPTAENLAVKNFEVGPKSNQVMIIGEVADYLKVTERTICRLAGATEIPARKVGGSWRFSRADIDAWIKEQATVDGSGTADNEV